MICIDTRRRTQIALRLIGVIVLIYVFKLICKEYQQQSMQLANEKQEKPKQLENQKASDYLGGTNMKDQDVPNGKKSKKKHEIDMKNLQIPIPETKRPNKPNTVQNQTDQKMSQAENTKDRGSSSKKNKEERQKKDKIQEKKMIQELTSDLKAVLKNILQRKFHNEELPLCKKGYYVLRGMKECKPWLTCKEINNHTLVTKKWPIGGGVGKVVYKGYLNPGGHTIAIVLSRKHPDRVRKGNRNLKMLQPSPYVVQLIGYCENGKNSTIITESGDRCKDLAWIQQQSPYGFQKYNSKERLRWLIKIIGGFDLLHHSMALPRVHCDLHSAKQFLAQYLLLEDGHVVMSDLDEIPEVDEEHNSFATCHEERDGILKHPEFIAPEQHYTPEEYVKGTARKPITEKADIWKFPDIAKTILKGSKYEQIFFQSQEKIHAKCKDKNPKLRPTARTVFIEYLKFYKTISE